MLKYTLKVKTELIPRSECFTEASAEELRVLLAIIAHGTSPIDAESLSRLAGTTQSRVKAAVTLFESEGILENANDSLSNVIYEFDDKCNDEEQTHLELANEIRRSDLHDLLSECENMLGKTLEHRDTARISALVTEKGVSVQYVLTMLAYLIDKRNTPVTAAMLSREVDSRLKAGITTLEELEIYIEEKTKEVNGEMEMRRVFGIYDRTLTPSERKYFKKWMHEYMFSAAVIGEAYDIAVNATSSRSYPYIDKILTGWHEAGCKTLDECRARADMRRDEYAKKNVKAAAGKKDSPKYATFDSDEALLRALERSYNDQDD